MNSSSYLDMLDELFRGGLAGLSEDFVNAQIRFVAGCQQSDGGFCGRQGGSDLYYTDFALRSLALLAPKHAAFDRAAKYIESQTGPIRSIVECFSLLNANRILKSFPVCDVREQLKKYILPQGGFARTEGDQPLSAYYTFLGALCFQMLDEELPGIKGTIHVIESLKRPDGGYAELDGQNASQTSATAAAVAFLTMNDAIAQEKTADTIRFLADMQSADGGFRAHPSVKSGDLLSTFTGLLTVGALEGQDSVDLPAAAKFIRQTALSDGGFLACLSDDTPDVEYAYYGLGSIALLRSLQ